MSPSARVWRGERSVERAASLLRRGAVIGFPTDTVYGLAASVEHPEAVRRISVLKGRPSTQPLILMVSTAAELDRYLIWNQKARELADRHWPGPLTLILAGRPPAAGLGGSTVGVRIPKHALALELLRQAGALATTSANVHGDAPVTSAEAAVAALPGLDGALADPHPSQATGEASSILDLSRDPPVLVRQGRLGPSELGLPVPGARS